MSWYQVDFDALTVETEYLSYSYGQDYLHNGSGVSITQFVDKRTGQNTAYGFDGQYKGSAWDDQTAVFTDLMEFDDYIDLHVRTGQTRKVDRIHRHVPALELIYQENTADWTEDFIRAHGPEADITFIMYGLPDVVSLEQGRKLWNISEGACGHNYGDCFIAAAGASLKECQIDGHFLYGYINRQTGQGTGFAYPTWITTREWKVWWTESHKIEIEYAPHGNTGRRLIFPLLNGREELLQVGRWWLRNGSSIPLR